MTDKMKNETMSMEELDHVAGGSYVELERDMRFLGALGIINKGKIPAGGVNENNFDDVNKLVHEAWAKFGVNMTGQEGVANTYSLPTAAASFGNNRAGALAYAKYTSGRSDVDISNFM